MWREEKREASNPEGIVSGRLPVLRKENCGLPVAEFAGDTHAHCWCLKTSREENGKRNRSKIDTLLPEPSPSTRAIQSSRKIDMMEAHVSLISIHEAMMKRQPAPQGRIYPS